MAAANQCHNSGEPRNGGGLPPLMEQVHTFVIDTIGCGIAVFER